MKNDSLELWVDEFFDIDKVLQNGLKQGAFNWLDPNGSKISHKDNYASIFRHVADACSGVEVDHDSGLAPELHAASRLLMAYTRRTRGIRHEDDIINGSNGA